MDEQSLQQLVPGRQKISDPGEITSQFCLSQLQVRTSEFKPAPSDGRPFSAEAGTAEVVSQEAEIFAFPQVSTLIRVVEFAEVCN